MDGAEGGDVRGGHGAQPGHGAGHGQGGGPDDGGEQLVGVGVDDAPAHLGHVLARHGQHYDGPLVDKPAQRHSRCGHTQQTSHNIVTCQVGTSPESETEFYISISRDERMFTY